MRLTLMMKSVEEGWYSDTDLKLILIARQSRGRCRGQNPKAIQSKELPVNIYCRM